MPADGCVERIKKKLLFRNVMLYTSIYFELWTVSLVQAYIIIAEFYKLLYYCTSVIFMYSYVILQFRHYVSKIFRLFLLYLKQQKNVIKSFSMKISDYNIIIPHCQGKCT